MKVKTATTFSTNCKVSHSKNRLKITPLIFDNKMDEAIWVNTKILINYPCDTIFLI